MAKIVTIKRHRVELTDQELESLQYMLAFYEENANEDDEISSRVRRDFGVKESTQIELLPDEHESLPEKALRIASGQRTSSRRKSRVTPE